MKNRGGGFGPLIASTVVFALAGAVVGVGLWLKPLESAESTAESEAPSDRPTRRELPRVRMEGEAEAAVPNAQATPSAESAGDAAPEPSPAAPTVEAPPSPAIAPAPSPSAEPSPADPATPSIPLDESPAPQAQPAGVPGPGPATGRQAATRELSADERRDRLDSLTALGDRLRALRGSWRLPMATERREWIVKSAELAEVVGLVLEQHAEFVADYARRVAEAPLQPPATGGGFMTKLLPELAATSTVPGTERRLDPELLAPWREIVQLLGALGAELESVADAHARMVAATRDALNSAMRNNIMKSARNDAREVLYSTDVPLAPPFGEIALRTILQDARIERELDALERAIAGDPRR